MGLQEGKQSHNEAAGGEEVSGRKSQSGLFRKGWRMLPLCVQPAKTFLQTLCHCEVTAEGLCRQHVFECMRCFFLIMGLCELLIARNTNGLLKRFCSPSACLWFRGMCDWHFAKCDVSSSSSLSLSLKV